MSKLLSSQIFSISGQIECVVAELMIERGKATKIELKDFPDTVARFDDANRPVQFAIIIQNQFSSEFNELIANLRA